MGTSRFPGYIIVIDVYRATSVLPSRVVVAREFSQTRYAKPSAASLARLARVGQALRKAGHARIIQDALGYRILVV